jgi:hypothetical protein
VALHEAWIYPARAEAFLHELPRIDVEELPAREAREKIRSEVGLLKVGKDHEGRFSLLVCGEALAQLEHGVTSYDGQILRSDPQ